MVRLTTMVVPLKPIGEPRQLVLRNFTRGELAVKLKATVANAIQFEAEHLVIEPRRFVVLHLATDTKVLAENQKPTFPKILVYARPVTKFNYDNVAEWLTSDNCKDSQIAHAVQVVVNDFIFSAPKVVLDLPGHACMAEATGGADREGDEIDADCFTAINIEADTDTANAIEPVDQENAIKVMKATTKMSTIDQEKLMVKVRNWLAWDKNEKTANDIRELAEASNFKELAARMNGQLLFGTAGIRARMDAGFARLNDLTIIQITHGFAKHMKNFYGNKKSNGVAIGFDGRHNSRRFAQLAANVFIRNNIPVYLFSEVCPTPVVSWATVKLKCDAGLIITASHNPKEDNGYKAYWSNGAQIIGPHDKEIVRIAELEPQPLDEYWDLSALESHPLLISADRAIEPYFEVERSLIYHKNINEVTPLKITYSAFHGVGYLYAKRMLQEFGFPDSHFISVKEQQDPDPDFPTVPFPNPEEGRKVLTLSIKTADAHGSTLIIANDPDADRIQIAEKQPDGDWYVFTGNEMGALLTWWQWENWHKLHPEVKKEDVYILNSAVSSQIVKTFAEAEGFKSDVTLTGFKWMGNKADDLRKNGKHVILAWEESIGYMPGHTMDKDGVSTAGMYAEMAAWLLTQGETLKARLFYIYHKYGFHLVRSSYWFTPAPTVTKQLFNSLRKDKKYPEMIGSQKVKYVRDLTIGYDNAQPDNKPVLPLSTSSEMITFTLENGSLCTLRASGTEPKIKYYCELKTPPGKTENDLGDVMKELDELEKAVVDTLLRPQQFGLIPRK
ncbi:hypothetical protein Q1695_015422 [Nippostrongylus brasiliensis]|nr:hypothetical protein Q1695_015422 [Nippostrongylus brasiliensis]